MSGQEGVVVFGFNCWLVDGNMDRSCLPSGVEQVMPHRLWECCGIKVC